VTALGQGEEEVAMSVLPRCASLRRLRAALGLALMALVFAPSASGSVQLDTVTATGGGPVSGLPLPAAYSNINITAQSGPSGQNPSGTASFTIGPFNLSGSVTCLTVTGPDRGAGAPGSPTTAVLNFINTTPGVFFGSVVTVKSVDNGGNGSDIFDTGPVNRAPTDCSLPFSSTPGTLTQGRAVVFDAPLLPTSKDQCKSGGWRNYPQFKNQGDCVSFVENGK
jgi:hypothetical protein